MCFTEQCIKVFDKSTPCLNSLYIEIRKTASCSTVFNLRFSLALKQKKTRAVQPLMMISHMQNKSLYMFKQFILYM